MVDYRDLIASALTEAQWDRDNPLAETVLRLCDALETLTGQEAKPGPESGLWVAERDERVS